MSKMIQRPSVVRQTTLLFLLQDDQILLAMKKRGFGAGRWNGVGGKVEPDETLEQALVRECQEEIGVTPFDSEKVAEHIFKFVDDTPDIHTHTFVCRRWQNSPSETEEMAPRWFKRRNIPYDDMWQDDVLWLPLILRGKKVRTTFTFDKDDNMLTAQLKLIKTLQ